ncbi:MAG TPA: CYTH domain-containing protein [Cytophagaceae bacterium]|nr:CYTH domain-containing protein [Cytophagaceae bacterium]
MRTTEIERKFLVLSKYQMELAKEKGIYFRQGYLSTDPSKTVRIRIKDNQAFLTVKGLTQGISRTEIESPISLDSAKALFESFITNEIQKIRRIVQVDGKDWEVDEFLGRHKGLWMAEIELNSAEEEVSLPVWAGREVSSEKEYFNSYLSEHGLNGIALV